jgi:hypothetical protein
VKYATPGQTIQLVYTVENKRENDTEEPRDIRFAVYVTKTRRMVLFKLLRQSDGTYEKIIQNMNPESPLIRFKGRVNFSSIEYVKPNVRIELKNLEEGDFGRYVLTVKGELKQYDWLNIRTTELRRAG